MIAALTVALVMVQGATQPPPPRADSIRPRAPGDTTRRSTSFNFGPSDSTPTIPLTPELEATAYRDSKVRTLVARARAARAAQDSTLESYRASAYQRMSVGSRVRALGRERLLARSETAMEIEWHREVGARVTIEGSRMAAPMVNPDVTPLAGRAIGAPSSIPYFPGRESLWPMGDITDSTDTWSLWRHPLRPGAEAYYRYATGDSIDFVLPNSGRIRLVEVRLEPRHPRPDLVAGSFWFDLASGQLVRAHYRPSVRMDWRARVISSENMPLVFRALARTMTSLRPFSLTVSSVSVDFALQEGRWWLPVRQAADAEAQATFLRIPVRVEERFIYAQVNGLAPIAPIVIGPVDSAGVDSTVAGGRESARARACRTGAFSRSMRYGPDSLAVELVIPCDSLVLVGSPAFPASIFDPTDDPLGPAERDLLLRTLGMESQAALSPGRVQFAFGPGLARYNRVEGLSLGATARQEFGAGYSADLSARVGSADVHPRGELAISRQDAFRSISVGAYERLAYANEWGSPLSFTASLNALLFGRDEGLYWRTTGFELIGRGTGDQRLSWRVFAERHRDADVETHESLARLGGKRFTENIDALPGDLLGAGVRLAGSHGENPLGVRAFGDLRLEGGTGDFDYGRAMFDATIALPIVGGLDAALSAAGGTSVGEVPPQRLWYLGGTQTIRGQPLAAASGDAFWMGRAEIGLGRQVARLATFYDLGWAGDRGDWRSPGRPLSGAGVGISLFDGMLRLDIARGVQPSRGWRGALFLDARF